MDLSQLTHLTYVYLERLPPLQLNITTPSLVDFTLSVINIDESLLLLSPEMLNFKRVKFSYIEMSAEYLQNNVKVLETLPQSATVEMIWCLIKPETERERFRNEIRSSQAFNVTRDYKNKSGKWSFTFKTIKPSKE